MVKNKELLLLTFILLVATVSFPWYNSYNIYETTFAFTSIYLPDRNVLIAGGSNGPLEDCAYFRWFDPSGDSLNTWILDDNNANLFSINDMEVDPSGENVYFTMVDRNYDSVDSLYIGKMSIDGDSVFIRGNYDFIANPQAPYIFFDSETTITVVSGERGYIYPNDYIVIAKGDTMGNLSERARYETPFNLQWPHVFRKDSSSFYCVCYMDSGAVSKNYIMELSNDGDSLRAARLPLDSCVLISCLYSPDNGIFLAGASPLPMRELLLCNLDTNFAVNWERIYSLTFGDEVIRDIALLPDGNIAASCLLWDFAGDYLALIIFDGITGDTIRSTRYDSLDIYIPYDLIRIPNGDFVMSGKAEDYDGPAFVLRVDSLGTDVPTSIEEIRSLPATFDIFAYPNPFNSAVTISLSGGVGASDARPGQVGIEIFDISGRLVADLPVTNCGEPQFVPTPRIWQPEKSLGSGVYLVRANIGENIISKRIVYLK